MIGAAPAWHEESSSVAIADGTLYGTLTIPAGSGPFPIALIIAGSGPTDRNGNSPLSTIRTDAYKLLAHDLAARGIASLRYDKRLVGQSAIPGANENTLRFDDFVGDAERWVGSLSTDKRFSGVSIIGHSEGSLIGMIAAQRTPAVVSYVSLEGAGRPAPDVLLQQFHDANASAADIATTQHILADLRNGKTVANVDRSLYLLFRPSVQPYLISWFRYDPAVEISKLTIPALIVQGTTDIQIGVPDAQRLKDAAPSAKLALISGMNHILRDAPADRSANIATYSQPSLPLDSTLVSTISDFILHPH